jgi:hypothetical protein
MKKYKSTLVSLLFLNLLTLGSKGQLFIDPSTTNNQMNPIYRMGGVSIGTNHNLITGSPLTMFEVCGMMLGNNAGDRVCISSMIANAEGGNWSQTGLLKDNKWLYRKANGFTWTSAIFHDGISMNNLFDDPQLDTKTWWRRDPGANVQSWGNAATTYMQLNNGKLQINDNSASAGAQLVVTEPTGSVPAVRINSFHSGDYTYALQVRVKRDRTKGIVLAHENYGNTVAPNYKETFLVYGNGQTYIGGEHLSVTNLHADALVQVGGKMVCKELVVIDPTQWADFVFDENYKLRSLPEVEAYYTENKHLPDVPDQNEVKANGINTAEMDATLLQKIEELTLYLVEQNKLNERQQKQISDLQRQLDCLQSK